MPPPDPGTYCHSNHRSHRRLGFGSFPSPGVPRCEASSLRNITGCAMANKVVATMNKERALTCISVLFGEISPLQNSERALAVPMHCRIPGLNNRQALEFGSILRQVFTVASASSPVVLLTLQTGCGDSSNLRSVRGVPEASDVAF
jgi:hypothetical protein